MEETVKSKDLALRLMAEHYPGIDIFSLDVIQSGGIKTIWKLKTSAGTVCLKRLRKSIPIVKFTTAAQAYLSGKGALVAKIIPTKAGAHYFIHEGYGLVLYQWIEGTDLEMDKNPEHLRAGIQGLARFQRDSVGFEPPEDCEVYDRMGKWPHQYSKMAEEFALWKTEAQRVTSEFHLAYVRTVDDIIGMAEKALDLLQSSYYEGWVRAIGKYGYLCHQDYGKGNALQTDQGVYVLDLDNLAYELPLRDLRKLISKRMEELGRWDKEEMMSLINCFETILPLTDQQRRVLYIDLLFPHMYYGEVKNPFKKGDTDEEADDVMECYQLEMEKQSVLHQLLL